MTGKDEFAVFWAWEGERQKNRATPKKIIIFILFNDFTGFFRRRSLYHPAEIASVGQAATQTPQSWHLAGSITCLPSFSEIASTGQSLTQEPQFTQASLILWAIIYLF